MGTARIAELDSRRGWSVAAAGALASGISFGTVYTFGAFFEAMVDDFDAGRGSTALVFGLTLLLFFGTGIVSGPLADRYGPRPLVFAGASLLALGLVATSRVDGVLGGYLTYSVGVGVGGGLIIVPMYAAAGGWFVRHRALAMGVVATGNGLGTLILVPLAERLISAHGWRTAYVILAVIAFSGLAVAGLVTARPPIPPAPPAFAAMRAVGRTTAFRRLFVTGMLFSVSLFIAFAFVVDFATSDGVTSSRAALLVGVIGASSVVGRLGLTAMSGRVPAVRLLQTCLAVQPLAFGLWLVSGGTYWLLVMFALLLGVAYGGYVALGPEVAALLFGVVGLGATMGLMFLGAGLGGLIGPPVAGWLADTSDGSTVPIAFALVVAAVSFLLSLAIPIRRVDLTVPAAPAPAAPAPAAPAPAPSSPAPSRTSRR